MYLMPIIFKIIRFGRMKITMNNYKNEDLIKDYQQNILKPLDKEKIIETITKTKNVITIEDASIIGGLGTNVKEIIAENKLQNINLKCYAYPDKFIEAGNVGELEEKYLFSVVDNI